MRAALIVFHHEFVQLELPSTSRSSVADATLDSKNIAPPRCLNPDAKPIRFTRQVPESKSAQPSTNGLNGVSPAA